MKGLLDFKLQWYTIVAILLLLIWLPMGLVMPNHWGWENGVLETLQMLFILGGAYASLLAAVSFPVGHRMRKFWYCTIIVWGLVFARELSFGRSFYPYLEMADGSRHEIGFWGLWRIFSFTAPWDRAPEYIFREEMMLGDGIYVFVFLIAIVAVIAMLRFFDWKNCKQVIKIPVILVVLFLCCMLLTEIVEQQKTPLMKIEALLVQQDALEEGAELIGYWCLMFIVFTNAFPKQRTEDEQISDHADIKEIS